MGRTVITDADRDIIEARVQSGESLRAIAKDYGVHWQTIQKRRQRWGQPPLKQGLVRGANHASWKGGEYVDKWGYRRIYSPDTGRAFPYVNEHTLIAEQMTGRRIRPDEVVHHINGIKTDNRPDNLLVLTRSEHKLLHAQLEALAFELLRAGDIVFDGDSYRWAE
jgi:hypothetical protein